jgi:membrane fusion protein (multidrug efflux system)
MRQSLILSIIFPIVITLSSCTKKKEVHAPPPPGVVCAIAEKKDVSNTVEIIGQIVAEDWVDLVARVEGFLIKQNFEEGSFVKKGDLVFEIDPRPFEANVKEAEGQLAHAQASLTFANIQVDRFTTLVKGNAAAQKDLDNANMQQGVSKGELLVAQGQLDLAKINLEYTRIIAPFDGKIGVCPISVGNLVGPTINNNLTKIVRIDPMKVEFSVPESIIIDLREREGSMANIAAKIIPRIILANGTEYPLDGRIYFSDNVVNTSTGTLLIRARFQNPKGLLNSGEYVKVRLDHKEKIPSVMIPAVAIQRDQTGEFVFTVDKDSKVQRRIVKTGQTHGVDIVILEGLSEGEKVIVRGVLKVRPGMTANVSIEESSKTEPKTQAPSQATQPGK